MEHLKAFFRNLKTIADVLGCKTLVIVNRDEASAIDNKMIVVQLHVAARVVEKCLVNGAGGCGIICNSQVISDVLRGTLFY